MVFDDLQVIAEAGSGEEAVALCDQYHPDVVLMELKMPGLGGIEGTLRIKARWLGTGVTALTGFGDREMVEGALKAAAIGRAEKRLCSGACRSDQSSPRRQARSRS